MNLSPAPHSTTDTQCKVLEMEQKQIIEKNINRGVLWRLKSNPLKSCVGHIVRIHHLHKHLAISWLKHTYTLLSRVRYKQDYMTSLTYQRIRLTVLSGEVSNPPDWELKLTRRFEIWQAHQHYCCRRVWQFSERSIVLFLIQILQLRYFGRSYNKTSYRMLKWGPGQHTPTGLLPPGQSPTHSDFTVYCRGL